MSERHLCKHCSKAGLSNCCSPYVSILYTQVTGVDDQMQCSVHFEYNVWQDHQT